MGSAVCCEKRDKKIEEPKDSNYFSHLGNAEDNLNWEGSP